MNERIIISMVVFLMIAICLFILNRWQKQKANASVEGLDLEYGKPVLVYFYSPACSVCKSSQKLILDHVNQSIGMGKLKIISIDVSEEIEIARQWGVTTLPTTCVVNDNGEVTNVNNGLVTAKVLLQQLAI